MNTSKLDFSVPDAVDYGNMLNGKRAFITTAGQGIGRDIARVFAYQGAEIAIGARNDIKLEDALKELREIAPERRIIGYHADLSDRSQTENVCDRIISDFGGIDILVCVAGINHHVPAHLCSEEEFDTIFDTNFKSFFRCMKKFVPGMLERRSGSIVNISSIHSIETMPGYMMYAASKGAINAASRAIALDYAKDGIRINNVCPGLALSDSIKDEVLTFSEGEEREAFENLLLSMQPLPPATVRDISNAVLFLASDMSSNITGQSLLVDGGASILAHPNAAE